MDTNDVISRLDDLVIEMLKHSNKHLNDADPVISGQAAVEGVCAIRIAAILKRDEKRSCNRHSDCTAAEQEFRKTHGKEPNASFHCHDDCCEDCFGQ